MEENAHQFGLNNIAIIDHVDDETMKGLPVPSLTMLVASASMEQEIECLLRRNPHMEFVIYTLDFPCAASLPPSGKGRRFPFSRPWGAGALPYRRRTREPATTRSPPSTVCQVRGSPSSATASRMVMGTLNLSTGATLEALSSFRAWK